MGNANKGFTLLNITTLLILIETSTLLAIALIKSHIFNSPRWLCDAEEQDPIFQ